MAELAFKVKADYDEVVSMREELARLRTEMLNMDTAVDGWKEKMDQLEKQYADTSKSLQGMIDKASEAGEEIKNNASTALKDASGSAEQLASTLSMVKDGLSSYIREKERSGEMDAESAKKARMLVTTLSGLQSILKAVQASQVANAKAAASAAASTSTETAATTGLATSQVAATATTNGLTTSVHGLNAAMKANPIGIALSLIPIVTGFLTDAVGETDSLTREIKEMNKETKKQLDYLDELYSTLEDTNTSTKKRREAIDEVNEICKEYNTTLLNENDTLEQQRIKYENLTVAIRNATAAKVGEKYVERAEEKADKQNKSSLNKLKSKFGFWTGSVSGYLKMGGVEDDVWAQVANYAERNIQDLADLSGAAYEAKLNSIVGDVMDKITDATGKDASQFKDQFTDYVKSLDKTERKLRSETSRILGSVETFTASGNGGISVPQKIADATFNELEAAWDRTAQDLTTLSSVVSDERQMADYAEQVAMKNAIESEMAAKAILGTRDELSERKKRLEKEINSLEEGSEKQGKLEEIVKAIDAELKSRTGKDDKKPKGNPKTDKEQKERERAYERYETQIKNLVNQIEGNIAKEQIAAIDDNEKAVLLKFDVEKRALIDKANEIAEAMEDATGDELDAMRKSYEGLVALIDRYDAIRRKNYNREREKAERDSMNQFLREYGTYEEKRLAITDEYSKKIEKSQTQGEKLALARQRDVALGELERMQDLRYSLIFADANSLSDTLLSDAIEATQKAIENAKSSGDIQALTELYKRLQAQMVVQGDRNRGWGFAAIAEGFGLRASANEKLAQTELLKKRIESLDKSIPLILDADKQEEARKKLEELRAELERLFSEAIQDGQKAGDVLKNGFDEVAGAFGALGSLMASFADGKGEVLDTIAEIGNGLSDMASCVDDVRKMIDLASADMKDKSAAWSTIITGSIELVSMIGKSIQNNAKAQEEWNRTLAESDHRLKMIELDKLSYEQSNIFGVEDPFKKATDSAEVYRKSMQGISELTDKLANGKVQTDTKKALNWGNIGKGAGTGAATGVAVGSFFGPAGAAIGTAIGAGIGAIAGALSTKVVPVFESLQEHYGTIFDPDTFELNKQLLADYDKLDEDTKQIVDHWDDIKKKAEEARKELKDNLSDFSGDLGKQLENTIVNAWKNHRLYSAVDDYKAYVGRQMASILEQQAFSAVFEGLFNDLGKRMEASFLGPNADNSIIDDMDDFNKNWPKYLEAYGTLMDQLDEQMQAMGYEGLRERQTNANASTQTYQQISETTGSAIQGGVTALRLSSEVRNQHLTLMSENLSEMLRQQMLSTNMAEDIRRIQADAYLALIAIRDNTAGNLQSVRNIEGLVERIEKQTREL